MQKACRNPGGPRHLVGTRFQVCFTPLTGVLFTFPSWYWFAIGHRLVFSLGGWAPRIRTEFHVFRPTWDPTRAARGFGYGAFTLYRRPFQAVPLPRGDPTSWSRNPKEQAPWFGLLRVRSPLLAQSLLFSSPAGTEMFHFPASRFDGLCIHPPMTASSADGLLHSEILGSKRVCRSPGLIAAYRVLRRLAMPRHPPCALSRLCVSSKPFRSDPRSVALAGHLPRSEAFASILTEVAASRPPRSGSQLFASKPRARFDCLEIELLMSSHSNFSRLPLSKSRKSAWNRFFRDLRGPEDREGPRQKLVGVTGVEPVTFTLSV